MNIDVIVTRIINAPLEQVWDSWTDPERVVKWWGPAMFTSPGATIDLKVGGKYLFAMRAPEMMGGQESYTAGTYRVITPMQRLEFTQALSDAEGNPLDTAHLPEGFPPETYIIVEFKPIKDDMTELVITEKGWTPGPMVAMAYAGMHQSLDKMVADLA